MVSSVMQKGKDALNSLMGNDDDDDDQTSDGDDDKKNKSLREQMKRKKQKRHPNQLPKQAKLIWINCRILMI